MTEDSQAQPDRRCPWCSAPAPSSATRCPSCGAALAQRDSIADLEIAGVTSVEPALRSYAEQPLHGALPMPSSIDPLGGSINLTGMAELADLASPYGTGSNPSVEPDAVGRPSDAALEAAERLDRERGSDRGLPDGGTDGP